MTSKKPAERFKQHKTGYRNKKGYKLSAYIVERYGSYLRPSLYDHINAKPMTRAKAPARIGTERKIKGAVRSWFAGLDVLGWTQRERCTI